MEQNRHVLEALDEVWDRFEPLNVVVHVATLFLQGDQRLEHSEKGFLHTLDHPFLLIATVDPLLPQELMHEFGGHFQTAAAVSLELGTVVIVEQAWVLLVLQADWQQLRTLI